MHWMADSDNQAVVIYRRMLPLTVLSIMGCAAITFGWVAALPIPRPTGTPGFTERILAVLVGYFIVAFPFAARRMWMVYRPLVQVYAEQRPARVDEQQLLLRQPARHALHNLGHWATATLLFPALTLASGGSRLLALRMAIAILLGGLSSSALVYLLIEWATGRWLRTSCRGDRCAPPRCWGSRSVCSSAGCWAQGSASSRC